VELTALPRPSSWNKGDLFLQEVEGCRDSKGKREGKARRIKGRAKKGRGGERSAGE